MATLHSLMTTRFARCPPPCMNLVMSGMLMGLLKSDTYRGRAKQIGLRRAADYHIMQH